MNNLDTTLHKQPFKTEKNPLELWWSRRRNSLLFTLWAKLEHIL